MKISYDKTVDAMYIKLKKGHFSHTKKVTDDVLVNVSKTGEVLGLEVLEASRILGKKTPKDLTIKIISQMPSV